MIIVDRSRSNTIVTAYYLDENYDVDGDRVPRKNGDDYKFKAEIIKPTTKEIVNSDYRSDTTNIALAVRFKTAKNVYKLGLNKLEIHGEEYDIVGFEHDLTQRERSLIKIQRNELRGKLVL